MAFLKCAKFFNCFACYLLLLASYSTHYAQAITKPLSVVIIGAGPAGLAAGIEARLVGAEVTLVEKRETYTRRNQLLFLFKSSLELLGKWQVTIPTLSISYSKPTSTTCSEKIGITTIGALEEALFERLVRLHVKMVRGEFKWLEDKQVSIATEFDQLLVPYDILIGSDGAHSSVRHALAISTTVFGKALARAASVGITHMPQEVKIPDAYLSEGFFIKRIMMPKGSVVIAQYPLNTPEKAQKLFELKKLEELAYGAGWLEESRLINSGKLIDTGFITVALQQANSFINTNKSGIIVGDAAAIAPFCQARGANTALEAAVLVAKFIIEFTQEDDNAYQNYNDRMKEITDELIKDSLYLLGTI